MRQIIQLCSINMHVSLVIVKRNRKEELRRHWEPLPTFIKGKEPTRFEDKIKRKMINKEKACVLTKFSSAIVLDFYIVTVVQEGFCSTAYLFF